MTKDIRSTEPSGIAEVAPMARPRAGLLGASAGMLALALVTAMMWAACALPTGPRGARRAERAERERGMTTAEYAIGTLAAATFAVVLIAVVRTPAVKSALAGVITTALGMR